MSGSRLLDARFNAEIEEMKRRQVSGPLRPIVVTGSGVGSGIQSVANYAALPPALTAYAFYVTEDTDYLYYWNLTEWLCISHIQ